MSGNFSQLDLSQPCKCAYIQKVKNLIFIKTNLPSRHSNVTIFKQIDNVNIFLIIFSLETNLLSN